MQIEALPGRPVDLAQEPQKLLGAMTRVAFADHEAAGDIQCREQRRRAVAFVVVGHGGGATGLQRQARLAAIEGLDLALLVHTQDQRLVRRVHIKPDNVGDFLLEIGIGRDLEGLDQMRLEPGLTPDPLHRRVADADRLAHRTNRPVRATRWRLRRRLGQHLCLDVIRQRFPTRRTRLVPLQPLDAFLGKPRLPAPHARLRFPRRPADGLDALTGRTRQDDLGPPNHLRWRIAVGNQALKFGPLLQCDGDVCLHVDRLTDLPQPGNPPSVTEH